MRASRLLSLLLLLQSRGRMTARELADELEVSIRTVYRDVDALSASGVPVYADRGPTGGYQLVDGYRTRLTGLTTEEADSLFLAGLPGPAAELGLGAVVAAVQLKVLAALPPELRSRAARVGERFHLDAPGWFRGNEGTPHVATIAEAVWQQRRLRIRYVRWAQVEVERTVEPLGLVLKAGTWYLVARTDDARTDDARTDDARTDDARTDDARTDEARTDDARMDDDLRTYRVSRVLELTPLDEPFDRPDGFDLAKYWQGWSERFEERLYPMRVTVRLTPNGLKTARVLLSLVAARELKDVEPQGEWTTVRVPVESLDHALVDLVRLGPDAEVLEPPELRERVIARLAAMTAVYRK
ncbi:putative DNA-binding transcriptional regulator YafY [Saccharothrix ecbatanensis]|uniref:Putative DNA-binding transcriptional regulator YafY n=1 Tax=Saccharothrix ecbatanensis TaxID=1105145 RepID=A0A7W9HMV2_9PSEU|nr:YafY family protein [Saccharothrix ecbatanensis]MBB5804684.1 putative DNA-binding transcriptional regulator YafY [Saccharothrix ecbatanensis]